MAIITVFVGSVRQQRHGRKVAEWVATRLSQRGHTVHLLDPLEHEDLLVMRARYKYKQEPSEDYTEVQRWVKESDGYVAVTPEYNHSYSGALKNAMDCFLEEYFFKPYAIVTYSNGSFGGVRAADPLRAVCAEIGAPAIPISLAVTKIRETFAEDGSLTDEAYNQRLDRMLNEFEWYMEAMAVQRKKGTPY